MAALVRRGRRPEGHLPPVVLDGGDLADYRTAHALSHVFPLLYDVLGRAAVDCDALMAVGDASGHLLWVAGARHVLRRAEDINFVEGSAWNEHSAGTNAPGWPCTSTDRPSCGRGALQPARAPVVVRGGAHPRPTTSAVLGVVDITGGPDVASRRASR